MKLFKWRRKKVVLEEDTRSSVSDTTATTATQTPEVSAGSKDQVQPGPIQSSFFQSSKNVEILGGQFSNTRGHHTNLTINFNQGGFESIPEANAEVNHVILPIHGQGSSLFDAENERSQQISGTVTSASSYKIFTSYYGIGPDGSRVLLSPTTPPVQKSSDIYYRHLSVKDLGYPLWIPEPNNRLPIQYQRRGIEIGDVGIITLSGSFDFLFNIRLPADDPINPRELPEQFSPLHPPLDIVDTRGHLEFKANSYLASASIDRSQRDDSENSGLTFQSSASEGTILAMPDGAYSDDLGNVARFRKYLSANAESWYRYVNGVRGREALNGDVRLVVGCHKTSTWGMATFADLRERKEFCLRFRPTGESSVGRTYSWDYTGMAEVRAGPDPQEIEELRLADDSEDRIMYRNQCLFLRTLNVTLRDDIWEELLAELELELELEGSTSGGSNLPPAGPIYTDNSAQSKGKGTDSRSRSVPAAKVLVTASTTEPSVHITGTPRNVTPHPSKAINEMLLTKKLEARMAITEDWNWMSVLKEDDPFLPSSEELCKRIREHYNIICDQEGVVYLHGTAENPVNNPDAAISIVSDTKTWADSKSPSHRSMTLSGTTLGSRAEDDGDSNAEDSNVRSLGLNRSRRGSVLVDTPPNVHYMGGVPWRLDDDLPSRKEILQRVSIPVTPQSSTQLKQLVRKTREQRTNATGSITKQVSKISQTPSPLRRSVASLNEESPTSPTEWHSGGYEDEVVKLRRRGLGRMLSLIRR